MKKIKLEPGKSYRFKIRRTTIDYISIDAWLYEIQKHKNKIPQPGDWITFKDIILDMNLTSKGDMKKAVIICLDDDNMIYPITKEKINKIYEQ